MSGNPGRPAEAPPPFPAPSRVLQRLRDRGFPHLVRYALHRAYGAYWERRLGVRTMGGYTLAADGVTNRDCHDYSPESYLDFERAMRWLSAEERRGVFLDCGSGKGRIVLRAACYPFRRVIGVELSFTLSGIARRNLQAARRRLACPAVEIVTTDAAEYEIPPDVTCVFLYNPFGGAVLEAVLGNLRRSLERNPRRLAMIVSNPDRVERALAEAGWMVKAAEFRGLRSHALYRAGVTPEG